MFFASLVVLASFCYASAAVIAPSLTGGYQVMDQFEVASCYSIPSNQICPNFNHLMVGTRGAPGKLATLSLNGANILINALSFFTHSPMCRHCVIEYACSNSLMKCESAPLSPFGFSLTFDVQRTAAACANISKVCPTDVQDAIVDNCTRIQTNPFDFAVCTNLTSVAGDICPGTNYMYPFGFAKFYPIEARKFANEFHKRLSNVLADDNCTVDVIDAYCQILRGPICSTDNRYRMYAINQQDCAATMNSCITHPGYRAFLSEACKVLPDQNAKQIPLPMPAINDSVNNGK